MNTMDIEIVFNASRKMGTIIICSTGSIGYSNLEKMAKIHFGSFKKDKNRILNNSRMEYWIGLIFLMQVGLDHVFQNPKRSFKMAKKY